MDPIEPIHSEDGPQSGHEAPLPVGATELEQAILSRLDDDKAQDIVLIDLKGKSPMADTMIVASGTSDRHVKAVAETVAFRAKEAGETPLGTEGVSEGEWALVDLNSVVVHVMLPKVRDFYALERLWSATEATRKAVG